MANWTYWDKLRLFSGVLFATLSMITLAAWNYYQYKERERAKAENRKSNLAMDTTDAVNID